MLSVHRVLIVEDDRAVRELLRTIITRDGFDVAEAQNGREALPLILSRDFNVVVMDLAMPEMDGRELLETLARAQHARRNVIVLTAVNLRDLSGINLSPVHCVMRKPFDIYEFRSRLRQAVFASGIHSTFWDVLDDGLTRHGTTMGDVQLLDPAVDGLRIVAHRGVDRAFLDHFMVVKGDGGSVCARALRAGAPLLVDNVHEDEAFRPHRKIAASTGFDSVASVPLLRDSGALFGMFSLLFPQPRRFSRSEVDDLKAYGQHAAAILGPLVK